MNTTSRVLTRPSPGWPLAPTVVAVALMLGGCVTPAQQKPPSADAGQSSSRAPSAPPPAAQPGQAAPAGRTSATRAQTPRRLNPPPYVYQPEPPLRANADGSPIGTRSAQSIRALLEKGTVSGAELVGEINSLRRAAHGERSGRAMSGYMGQNKPGPAPTPMQMLQATALRLAFDEFAKTSSGQALRQGSREIDRHIKALLADGDELKSFSVKLPSPAALSPAQQQRAVTLAALVVLAHGTKVMLARARDEFKDAEAGFIVQLQRREKQATLLYQALDPGSSTPTAFAQAFSAADRKLLESFKGMSVTDFAQDMAAQNLAMQLMKVTDPEAYAAYTAESKELVSRTNTAVRAVVGVVAFSALVVAFSDQIQKAYRTHAADVIDLAVLVLAFAKEVPEILKVAVQAGVHGVQVPFKSGKSFRVLDDVDRMVEFGSAKDVFAELGKRDAESVLSGALFRNGHSGLLHKMFLCSPSEAGRLLDSAVTGQDRSRFATEFLGQKDDSYSFATSFEMPEERLSDRERDLGEELLKADHRERTTNERLPFAKLQKVVAAGGYKGWSDEQLLRLIFTNREGQAQHATLELGNTRVRPIANARSLYAYESLVDLCRGLTTASASGTTVPTAITSGVNATTGNRGTPTPPTPPRRPTVSNPRPAVAASAAGR